MATVSQRPLTVVEAAGLAVAVVVGWGAPSLVAVVLVIALPRVVDAARITRAQVVGALAEPFVAAARASGASQSRILFRHALPQAFAPLAVAAALTAATAVLAEAALGFVGFGIPTPTASWGELLKQAHENDG